MLCMMPGMVPALGGGNDCQTDPERTEATRKKAIRVYLAISLIHVVTGLTLFAFSSVAVHYHSGGGFPYFIGSFVIGGIMIISSMVAFRVYNKGPLFTTCEISRSEVLCAINWHRVISFMMFFVCVFGLAIIWMYGLCVTGETECSYEEHVRTNKTISITVFVLGCVGLVTSAFGVALFRKFGKAFGLQLIPGQRGGLRYVGFSDDVVSELRRQNAEMQRQLGMQHNCPQMPPGCQGFTNYGFEPPTPPPYTPTAVGVSIIGGTCQPVQNQQTNLNPPKYSDLQSNVFPNEPPPPAYNEPPPAYKETSGDSDDTENQNERTDM